MDYINSKRKQEVLIQDSFVTVSSARYLDSLKLKFLNNVEKDMLLKDNGNSNPRTNSYQPKVYMEKFYRQLYRIGV